MGDAALVFDPLDIDAIARRDRATLGGRTLRRAGAPGATGCGAYDWAETARTYRAHYRVLAGEQVSADDRDRVDETLGPLSGMSRITPADGLSVAVVPSFNQARHLASAIDSVLAQEYPNLDYLVVDAMSSDGTAEVLAGYGDRIRWISEPDDGQADAVDKAIQLDRRHRRLAQLR